MTLYVESEPAWLLRITYSLYWYRRRPRLRPRPGAAPLFYLARFNLQVLSTTSIMYPLSKIRLHAGSRSTKDAGKSRCHLRFDSSWCVETLPPSLLCRDFLSDRLFYCNGPYLVRGGMNWD
jgi:hypothetical protein